MILAMKVSLAVWQVVQQEVLPTQSARYRKDQIKATSRARSIIL